MPITLILPVNSVLERPGRTTFAARVAVDMGEREQREFSPMISSITNVIVTPICVMRTGQFTQCNC
jgi:hypothetical protein